MARLPVPVRYALSLPIRRLPFPILGGPNRGRLWSLAALGRGVVTGRYERHRFELLEGLVQPGDCVWDAGAHRGYAALIAASRVGPGGSVLAFEPAAVNRWYLERHVQWNRRDRVRTFPFALGASDGESTIGAAGSSVSYALGQGSEPVRVRSVASLLEEDGLEQPTLLKIDVEGAEARVLEGARGHLGPGMTILLSVHSQAAYSECAGLLRHHGFAIHESPKLRQLKGREGRWHVDPDLLASGRERVVPERLLERFDFSIEHP